MECLSILRDTHINYITTAKNELQPMGPNFALLPETDTKIKNKEERKLRKAQVALQKIKEFKDLIEK